MVGVLRFFSRQRFSTALAIYAVVFVTWGLRWHFAGWGDSDAEDCHTPLYWMIAQRAPRWLPVALSLLSYVLSAAIMQSVFSRVHPGQSKNYLMHLFVPLLSTMTIKGAAWGSPAAALGTLASLYVLTLLLTKEERAHADTIFRTCLTAGIASLIYYPSSVLLLVVVASLAYNNDLTIKKLLIAIVGFVVPFAFAAGMAILLQEPVDSYIGIERVAHAMQASWPLRGAGRSHALPLWGGLLLMLFALTISVRSRRSKTILTAYHDVLLRLIGFLSVAAFIALPASSALPVMVAPVVGSSFIFYFTSKNRVKLRGWTFVLALLLIIMGNIWGVAV